MSKPRYRWWGYAKNVLRGYPLLRKSRDLNPTEQRELQAVEECLRLTEQMPTGRERCRLAEMVFFRQSHTLAGAAMRLSISYDTAVIYHRELVYLVGKCLGLAQ